MSRSTAMTGGSSDVSANEGARTCQRMEGAKVRPTAETIAASLGPELVVFDGDRGNDTPAGFKGVSKGEDMEDKSTH